MASNESRLAAFRKEAGLTQSQLAQILTDKGFPITQAQVSKYEDAEEIPPRLTRPWANAIGRMADELLPPLPVEEETLFKGFDDSLYSSLTEDLNLLLQYTDRFPNSEEAGEKEVSPTVAQFRDGVTALREKPWVVVAGHFDTGKSHLCNYYLGGRLLPASYRPTTKYPTFVRHVSDRPDWIKADLWLMGPEFDPERWYDEEHCKKNQKLAGSWDTLEQHATWKGVKGSPFVDSSSTPWVAGYQDKEEDWSVLAFVDAPLLHSCVLVDLPGYDDPEVNAALIDKTAERASTLLYMSRAPGFLDEGDSHRLKHLLRRIPHYEALDESFPTLGNLFVVASHAHPGIKTDELNDILRGRARELYEDSESNLLKDLETQIGRTVRFEDVAARFYSFWQEIPTRREKLEKGLHTLLGTHMPSLRAKRVEKAIVTFKEQGNAVYGRLAEQYEKILKEKNEAKSRLEELEKAEPARQKEHATQVESITRKISAFRDRDLEHLRAVFGNETSVESLEAMIERRYANKKAAQKRAVGYVLEEIQSKTTRFRQDLVDDTRDLIEKFLQDYNDQMGKFNDKVPGEVGVLFDARAVFLGGLAGLGTLGALGAWATTLGNLGGYIIVSKVAGALGISSLLGGSAGTTAAVATLGGPVILALGIAVGVAAGVWRLLTGSWQQRLAKKIRDLFEGERVLSVLEDTVKKFWDEETLTAFQKGADSLDGQYRNYLDEMRTAFGGSQENLEALERRLRRYEDLKSFFAAIPWRSIQT